MKRRSFFQLLLGALGLGGAAKVLPAVKPSEILHLEPRKFQWRLTGEMMDDWMGKDDLYYPSLNK